MQSTSGVDRFSFGPSFWQAHDDEQWKLADNSDKPSNHRHSLPAQDYHNVTKIRGSRKTKNIKKSGCSKQGSTSLARRPDISNLSKEKRATGNDQTLPKHQRYDSDVDRFSFHESVAQTLHQADMMVAERQEALKRASRNERSLLLECEMMRDENDKLKKLNSANVTFQRDITDKLDGDLQSMTLVRNELQQQLRFMNLQKNLDREEFEKCLHVHTVVIHTD